MITEATVRLIKHPPEKIPDSWFGTVPPLAEVAPPILDLRRFTPYVLTLADIQLPPDANVIMRARYNGVRVEENTAALLRDNAVPANALVGAWSLVAKEFLYYNLLGVIAGASHTHFGVWGTIPTVADKLAYDIALSNEERELAERLGIVNSVEKGVLPLPRDVQIAREYLIVGEETHSRSVTIAAPNTSYTIESIYAREGEFLVLTRIASASLIGEVVHLIVDRDDDHNYADVRTYPLSLIPGGEVRCFIPAMEEIRLTTTAAAIPAAARLFRYTILRVKLTNLLRARFGLVSRDEVPGDTYDKVRAGVL